ncbi:MAG: hypothetical protein ACD_78C00252G0002, partial [uncultured bacterium (gcode 4)]
MHNKEAFDIGDEFHGFLIGFRFFLFFWKRFPLSTDLTKCNHILTYIIKKSWIIWIGIFNKSLEIGIYTFVKVVCRSHKISSLFFVSNFFLPVSNFFLPVYDILFFGNHIPIWLGSDAHLAGTGFGDVVEVFWEGDAGRSVDLFQNLAGGETT